MCRSVHLAAAMLLYYHLINAVLLHVTHHFHCMFYGMRLMYIHRNLAGRMHSAGRRLPTPVLRNATCVFSG